MSIYYLMILLPAVLVTMWGYHNTRDNSRWDKITSKEMKISLLANFIAGAVMMIIINAYIYGQVMDSYILNGKVTNKYQETTSCEHSYQICTSNGKTTTCVTHYEHFQDYNWVVKTTIGSIHIDRVDRQGTKQPPRFSKVIIGEPASLEFHYNNYLLADKSSLFLQNADGTTTLKQPSVYDYYRVNHVVGKDEPVLEEHLKTYLQGKRFNIKLVFIKNKPVDHFYTIMKTWVGGKINDIIIVVSEDAEGKVQWVKTNSYAKGINNQMVLKTLEAEVNTGDTYSLPLLKKQLQIINNSYTLPSEDDFEEKLSMVEVPIGLLIVMMIVNLIISIFIHIKMKQEDL